MKKLITILGFIVVLLFLWFCWFELRPANVKEVCYNQVITACKNKDCTLDGMDKAISICMKKYGS